MRYFILIYLIFLSLNIYSEDNSIFSGYLMSYDYVDITEPLYDAGFFNTKSASGEYLLQDRVGLRLQLRVSTDITKDISVDSSINFEQDVTDTKKDPSTAPSDNFETYFKEGFISIRDILGRIDAKIGRQYIFWGRFEWGGGLDVISPWDFEKMSAEKENFRAALDSAQMFVNFENISFELLFVPIFSPSRMGLKISDTHYESDCSEDASLCLVQKEGEAKPFTLENSEFGIRATINTPFDSETTLSWFKGYDRTFSMFFEQKVASNGNTMIVFTPKYLPIQLFGLDTEFSLFGSSFILEGSYLKTDDSDGENIFVKNSRAKASFGFESDITGDLSVMLVYSFTYLFDYDRQKDYDGRYEAGDRNFYVERQMQHELVYRVRYNFSNEFSVQLMQLFNIIDLNFMTLAFVNWQIGSNLKIYSGTVVFKGKEGTRFGRLENQSRFFFEIKYMF
ncbi:hypothetical protein JXR93_12940 [bacterium]|nr:hypothetical protein [bacterium]